MPIARARDLYATFRHLVHEIAAFGIVGAFNFAVDVGLFNVLLYDLLDNKPITDKAISTAVATMLSYFMNRHWTWRHRERTGLHRELPLFFALSAVGLGITEACLAVSHYALGFTSVVADNVAANGFGLVLGMLWRFWSFKRWVFLAPPAEPTRPATPVEAAVRTLD